MSEDIQGGGAVPPRRKEPRYDDDYGPESDYLQAPPFPGTVTAAGVIWIVFGSLVLLNLLIVLVGVLIIAANARGAAAGSVFGAGLCMAAFIGLIGGAFLFVGIQSVKGTARDTLGNGVGSILLGVLCGGWLLVGALGIAQLEGPAAPQVGGAALLSMALSGLEMASLVAAGVLALVGRGQYRLWKQAQRSQRARERAERIERRRFQE